jgi:hypothetical protein
VVESAVFQLSVTVPPTSGSVAGVAMKLVMVGAVGAATATDVVAVTVPTAFVAVKVKVVPAVTLTLLLVAPLTSPIPLSMDSVVAPDVIHDSCTAPPPAASVPGVAENVAMVGTPAVR